MTLLRPSFVQPEELNPCFGLLAKAKLAGVYVSVWFWTKIGAWFLFGMLPIVIRKTPEAHRPKLLLVYSIVPAVVVYLVLNKTF